MAENETQPRVGLCLNCDRVQNHLDEAPKLRVYKFAREVIDPLRAAVAALQDRGDESITLEGQIAAAIAEHVRRLAAKHNSGRPFPPHEGSLKYGWRRGRKR